MADEQQLREWYRAQRAQISAPSGSPERSDALERLWFQYLVRRLKNGIGGQRGMVEVIHHYQDLLAQEYFNTVKDFYDGVITGSQKAFRHRRTLYRYGDRMFAAELLVSPLPDTWPWMQTFLSELLDTERALVPDHSDGFTEADATALCIPIREYSREFFRRVHLQFGIPELQARPNIFGGVLSRLAREEEGAA